MKSRPALPPRCVIFDLDGTLLDSEGLYSEASQQIADRFGKRYTMEIKRRCIGGDARRSAAITIDALGLPLGVEEFLSEREAILMELITGAEDIEVASALLAELAERSIPVALATSSYGAICDVKLKGRPFERQFSAVICGDDPRLQNSKPAPDIFLLAADDLSARPEECIVFEDSDNGVRAGLAAGMRVVAVVDPRYGFEAEKFPELEASVPNLAELRLSDLGF